MNPMIDIETKLSAARTRLIIDKPFLGALVLRLPLLAGDPGWCRTTATDARKIFYNPDYIEQLNIDELQFVLSHEALHCALSHFARRGHRIKMRWDLACDYAINPLLIKEGLKPAPNSLVEKSYEGMTAEEIYPFIDEFDNNEPMDDHLYDDESESGDNTPGQSDAPPDMPDSDEGQKQGKETGKQSRRTPPQQQNSSAQRGNQGRAQAGSKKQSGVRPPPLSVQERATLNLQWKQRLAGAAQQAMQAGKLGEEMARLVGFLLQPELPWRNLLAHFMTQTARDDYSYTRPSSRRGEPAIYPSLRSAQINIIVAVDTSGSISETEIEQFISEIDAIKSLLRARITLLACDAELAHDCPWVFESWDEFRLPGNI
ncbi:hypothetical protein MNBD_GAMMA24-2210, partial [hydrothermal vent metagenome]